jgi:hypothetical protein
MSRLFCVTTILVAGIAGCAASGVQQSSVSDLGGNSKIILADRTGDVDGHKIPFAKEYVVAPGNHVVGVCSSGVLCEKYYYIKFDAKPGYIYTVYSQARSIGASNQAGHLIDTQGFGNELRDGVSAVISFNDDSEQPPQTLRVHRNTRPIEVSAADVGRSVCFGDQYGTGYSYTPENMGRFSFGARIVRYIPEQYSNGKLKKDSDLIIRLTWIKETLPDGTIKMMNSADNDLVQIVFDENGKYAGENFRALVGGVYADRSVVFCDDK